VTGAVPGPGATVAGRFRIVRQLGAGGTGTVFEAVQLGLERKVALKLLHAHVAALPGAPERFRREAMLLARLRHPNTAEVYDWGEEGDSLYLAMELLHGEALDELVYRGGSLALPRVVGLLAQVLEVLEAAHALGIIHRDIKPSNLMVCALPTGEQVKLLDLGLATVVGDAGFARLTQTGFLNGTPAYMSPEQSRAQPVDGRSDLYALGCVLYELLVGAPPFGISPPLEVLAGHIYRPVRPPSEVRPGRAIPAALERLTLRALAKRPEERPATAAEMRASLLASLDGAEEPGPRARRLHRTPPTLPIGPPATVAGTEPVGVVALDSGAGPAGDQGVLTALTASGFAARSVAGEAPGSWSALVVVAGESGAQGLAVARELAAWPGAPPVLLCGPDDDLQLMTASIEAGLFDYVPMPLDAADLVRKVSRAQKPRR